jgi:hypothetical protein
MIGVLSVAAAVALGENCLDLTKNSEAVMK